MYVCARTNIFKYVSIIRMYVLYASIYECKYELTARRCHHPGDIPNGRRDGNVFIYPHKVTYSCSEGYELVGSSYRICQASGQWSRSLPRCRRKYFYE